VHTTEKALSEHGDKIDAGDRTAIENAIAAVKEAVKSDDADAIKSKTDALAQASMKLGEAMYKAQQDQGGQGAAPGEESAPKDENVVDAEFSEVDEDKKKGAA
jgi:molecular chaperone DnaK